MTMTITRYELVPLERTVHVLDEHLCHRRRSSHRAVAAAHVVKRDAALLVFEKQKLFLQINKIPEYFLNRILLTTHFIPATSQGLLPVQTSHYPCCFGSLYRAEHLVHPLVSFLLGHLRQALQALLPPLTVRPVLLVQPSDSLVQRHVSELVQLSHVLEVEGLPALVGVTTCRSSSRPDPPSSRPRACCRPPPYYHLLLRLSEPVLQEVRALLSLSFLYRGFVLGGLAKQLARLHQREEAAVRPVPRLLSRVHMTFSELALFIVSLELLGELLFPLLVSFPRIRLLSAITVDVRTVALRVRYVAQPRTRRIIISSTTCTSFTCTIYTSIYFAKSLTTRPESKAGRRCAPAPAPAGSSSRLRPPAGSSRSCGSQPLSAPDPWRTSDAVFPDFLSVSCVGPPRWSFSVHRLQSQTDCARLP